KRIDEPTGTSFVGHEWDGIEELDTPMPRWWLYTFYACIAFAAVMVVLYPAIPMLHSATTGVLGWSSHGDLDKEMAADHARRAPVMRALAQTPIEKIPDDPKLLRAAQEGGHSAFKVYCTQCHG
ncbi:cytochrome C oxidase Cbb3, partial [Escherichia coli]|uniref:cbb3-type cytochrome c oxidase N-terminal domain-containing protein n=3 Tax=Pseudomonadota TaxID=1224 RepID=UPI0012D067AC